MRSGNLPRVFLVFILQFNEKGAKGVISIVTQKPRDFTRLTQEDGSLSRENLYNLVVS